MYKRQQKSTAYCPGWSNVNETVLPLPVGIICAWLGRIRAEVNVLVLFTWTVTEPAKENDVQEVACSEVEELLIPLGCPLGRNPGFCTW